MKDQSVYSIVTERIISLLEQGTVPWQKPWNSAQQAPQNLISRKPYRGINVFLLSNLRQYSSPFWVTYKQAQALQGNVRRGEKGYPVIFWKFLDIQSEETSENEKIPLLRYYTVFNVAQCDGITVPTIETPTREHTPIEAAERIVANMPKRPEIRHGFSAAYYSPAEDYVAMPNPESFRSTEDYYSVLAHELCHSTGHETRLNRKGVARSKGLSSFGSPDYSIEELTAEFGACFVCAEAGISNNLQNSASYISAWLERLRNDSKLVVHAAAAGQKCADFILGRTKDTEGGEQ